MDSRLELCLLGTFHVQFGGAAVAFRYDKQRALLVYLAVEARQAHRREALAALLWPDVPDADARRNLSQALFNLRQVLGEGSSVPTPAKPFLLANRETLQFNPSSDHSLDVSRFQGLIAACERHPHTALQTCAECAARLQEATGLYRGDFLQHFFLPDSTGFEEWMLLKREDLRRQALAVLAHLTAYFEAQTDYEQARQFARRQLTLEPWREEAHRDLMRLLALEGQRSAALAQYETCRKVMADELGVAPAPETHALYEAIRAGEFDPTVVRSSQPAERPAPIALGLPALETPFVGRAEELVQIGKVLGDPECRMLTLVGPGGIGKTRLAIQAAVTAQAGHWEQVYFVPLAPVTEVSQLVQALAHAVRLPLSGPAAAQAQLFNFLREQHALLVLDNFEHLIEAAPLLIEILQQAPHVKLLLTSRERLNVQGEWALDIAGLPWEASAIETGGALDLFEQTARRAQVGFTLAEADRPAVIRICQLLGGLPLAIQIAASWTRVLTCQEIADEIQRDLGFLTTSNRDVPERHRSVRGVLEQAWRRLDEDDQQVLCRLAAFRGGFQRQAAEHVAEATLQQLATLNAKSLLRLPQAGRYDLHELIRQYAAERLAEDHVLQAATRQRHATYFAEWLAARAEPLRGPRQLQVWFEIRAETANWHSAWEWAVASSRLDLLRQMTPCMYWYYEIHGYYAEALTLFQQAESALRRAGAPDSLAEPDQRTTFAFIVDQVGWFLFRIGQVEAATAHFAESLALAGADAEVRYYIHGNWAFLALLTGDLTRAQLLTDACLADARTLDSAWHMAIPLNMLGMVAQTRGQAAEAHTQLRESLRLWRRVGDPRGLVFCLNSLGATAIELGQHAEAAEALRESLALAEANGDRWAQAIALGLLGQASLQGSAWAEARDHFQRSVGLYQAIGDEWSATQGRVQLGDALAGLGDRSGAQALLERAYDEARRALWWPTVLEALTALADLRAGTQPDASRAVACAVIDHPAAIGRVRARAQRLRDELPPARPAADAAAQAGAAVLDDLAASLLSPHLA